MRRLALNDGDSILTAYAERATGPGWSNTPVWLIVRDGNGKIRQECLQPDQQTADIATMYRVSEAAHSAMTDLVLAAVRTRRAP